MRGCGEVAVRAGQAGLRAVKIGGRWMFGLAYGERATTRVIFTVVLMAINSVVGTLIQAVPAWAEDVNPMIFPANRYARENTELRTLAHWPGGVSIQFVGIEQQNVQLAALTEFISLSAAAQAETQIIGFPNTIFDFDRPISTEANIVVMEYNSAETANLKSGNVGLLSEVIDGSEINNHIKEIFKDGLIEQNNGCLARWSVNSENEIEGFVLAISQEIDVGEKISCISTLAPAAFGISPVVSLYYFSDTTDTGTSQNERYFSDKSELYLELKVAAMCREEKDEFGPECPYEMMLRIFSHHADLVKTFGQK